MSSPKSIYDGRWIRVANMRNKTWKPSGKCRTCGYLTAGTVWMDYETNEIRCESCMGDIQRKGVVPNCQIQR